MQANPSLSYPDRLRAWCRAHADDPDVAAQLERYAEAIAVLLSLDLEPARPILAACYAASPRGGHPWDPVALFRALLLALLVGIASVNALVAALRSSQVLRALAGFFEDAVPVPGGNPSPGVGTFYDFLHRLHDGRRPPGVEGYVPPSALERARARAARPPGNEDRSAKKPKGRKGKKKKEPGTPEETEATLKAAERTLAELRRTRGQKEGADLLSRMSDLLWTLAVLPSAEQGLLGDVTSLVVTGDGSPLVTGASGSGVRTCACDPHKPCGCPRRYADPDARWGYDPYRERYFFGHHFYELQTNAAGRCLPLLLRLDPGNETDFTAGLRTLEAAAKRLAAQTEGGAIDLFIADLGHDSMATFTLCDDHQIRPVLPISGVPAVHPTRPEIKLSPRAIPLCPASVEMAPWGSGGPGRPAFACPVKAGKIATCPLAPKDDPGWLCQPDTRLGPVVSVRTETNPRLFPAIPRNSTAFQELYRLRSGTERSNALKKGRFRLEDARHRRASFWTIRLHLIALLQHALAWVEEVDLALLVASLLGREQREAA